MRVKKELRRLLGPQYDELDKDRKCAFKVAYKCGSLSTWPANKFQLRKLLYSTLNLYECGTPIYITDKGMSYFAGERYNNEDNTGFLLFGRHGLAAFIPYHSGQVYYMGRYNNMEDTVTLSSTMYISAGIFSEEPYQVFSGCSMPAEGYAAAFIDDLDKLKKEFKNGKS